MKLERYIRTPIQNLGRGWLIGLLAVTSGASCGTHPQPGPRARLPGSAEAHKAVQISLGAWRDSPELPVTSSPSPSLMFVDQQRRPGQHLRSFALLGESEVEGCRRIQVKLSLEEPVESRLVAYYVFGQDPMWVYRTEDFDMIMHWECAMPADASPGSPESQ